MDPLTSDFFRYFASWAQKIPGWFLRRKWPAERILANITVVHWDSIAQLLVGTERTRHCIEFGGLYLFNSTPLTMKIVAAELRFSVNSAEFGTDHRRLPMRDPLPAFGRGGYMYQVDIPPALVQKLRDQASDYVHLQIGGFVIVETIHGDQRVTVHKNIAAPISRDRVG